MVAYLRERGVTGTVEAVRVHRNPGNRYRDAEKISGMTLHTICRRGKHMVFHLSGGIAVAHNAMTGYWDVRGEEWCFDYVEGKRDSKESDVRIELDVRRDGELKTVRFHDARLFGSFRYYPTRNIDEIPALAKLGPEPIWTPNADTSGNVGKWNWSILDIVLFSPQHEIKHALMDQHAVAGVGNIYATEALWLAGVHPARRVADVTTDEWVEIFDAVQKVLQAALDRRLDYSQLRCYRQKTCVFCKSKIEKTEIRKRSTWHCPKCQPADAPGRN